MKCLIGLLDTIFLENKNAFIKLIEDGLKLTLMLLFV